jgi:hypothetical protein
MAAKAKGVCLACTVDHDGKRYAPGMPVPLSKVEGERLAKKLGEWEGDPVQGEPVSVARAMPRRPASNTKSDEASGSGMVVMTHEQYEGVIGATTKAVATHLSEDIAKQVKAFTDGLETLIADASAASAQAVIESLNAEVELAPTDEAGSEKEGSAVEPGAKTDARAS